MDGDSLFDVDEFNNDIDEDVDDNVDDNVDVAVGALPLIEDMRGVHLFNKTR
jgi:hypothetical protein